MQYIALYTAPALLSSKTLFNEKHYYFFGNIRGSSFRIDELKRAQYLGIGEEITKEKPNYLHIEFLGKITTIRQFTIKEIHVVGNEVEIENVEPSFVNGTKIEKREIDRIQDAFRIQVSNFHISKSSGDIQANIPTSWYSVEVENPIKVNEDKIAYQSKALISFPLNLNSSKQYISSDTLMQSIKVGENVFYHIKKNVLIVNGGEVVIGGSNEKLYGKIIELLSTTEKQAMPENPTTTVDILNEEDIPKKIKKDIESYKNVEKNFNKANFSQYLDFLISISSRGIISKRQR